MGDGPRPQASPSAVRSGATFFLTLLLVIVIGALGGYALGRYVFDRLMEAPHSRIASLQSQTLPPQATPAPAPAISRPSEPVAPASPGRPPAQEAAGQLRGSAGGQAAPTGPSTATPSSAFFVQVGAFGSAERADALVVKLRQQGYPVTVEILDVGKQPLYKVRVGPYSRREDAQKALQQLKPTVPDAFIP